MTRRSEDPARQASPPKYPDDCFWLDSTTKKCELRALLERDDVGQISRICTANEVAVNDMKHCSCSKAPLKKKPAEIPPSLRKALSRHLR